jgi:transcriptional accessory protein Tex/SPT6
LAFEFGVAPDHVRNAFEMLDAGLSAPFIGRFRRDRVDALSESTIRRLQRRRTELEELDRRRGTILRLLEKEPSATPQHLEEIRNCMDRFELEDLFIPHRRPEPEVQLALDRGLGALADLLTTPIPKAERDALLGPGTREESDEDADEGDAEKRKEPSARGGDGHDVAVEASATEPTAHAAGSAAADVVASAAAPASDVPADAADDAAAHAEAAAHEAAPHETAPHEDLSANAEESDESEHAATESAPTLDAPVAHHHVQVDLRAAMNAQLARVCAEFVRPDKGIHTELEALSGALRILSDRLGRNARLRGQVRNIMRKQGVLSVRAAGDERRLGRHRSLLRIRQPLRQLQGHRLVAIRQGQKERIVNTVISLDTGRVVSKVRAALGRHLHPAYEEVLADVAQQALQYRLLPMVEQDVRLELKERGDQEALRFLSQHLRQILLAPPLVGNAVAGLDLSAKGDWTVAVLDAEGNPVGPETRIEMRVALPFGEGTEPEAAATPSAPMQASTQHAEAVAETAPSSSSVTTAASADSSNATSNESTNAATNTATEPAAEAASNAPTTTPAPKPQPKQRTQWREKTLEELGHELGALLVPHRAWYIAVGHGKAPRAAATKIRAALKAANVDAGVMLVNESGLSSYANSELARRELPDRQAPGRMAISLGRRLQDPLEEILKVDPRHLGLGLEQGLVSKANAKRVFTETIESCTAHVGCDVNRATELFLSHLPGLGAEGAKRIVAHRATKPITSREELRTDSILTEAQWISVAAFLRVPGSSDPLDASNLHPEQYPLVRRLLESAGSSLEQGFGRMGSTKGLRRADFDVDEWTWRDLMREIAHPGRDPRPRLWGPILLDPDTDPVRLVKDRVVEGIVSNVTSFGAFVDVGLPSDAMVHISEISDRYVRDARELLSIGQIVRARIVDPSGARMGLSLKNVPFPAREGGGEPRGPRRGRRPQDGEPRPEGAPREGGGDRGGPRGGRGREGGRGRFDREPKQPANVRAAQTRRDGLGSGSRGSGGFGRGGGGGGQRGGGGGGGARPGGGRREGGRGGDFGDREDFVKLKDVAPGAKPANNPFASFFKGKKEDE